MKAIVIREQGGPEQLRLEEVPDPVPGPGQAVVSVRAVSVNRLDIWLRAGQPGRVVQLPLTPGGDIAGVVRSVGPGTDPGWVGRRVVVYPGLATDDRAPRFAGDESFSRGFGVVSGGYAEQVAVPAACLVALPDSLDWVTAAAFPVTYTTAWHMLASRAKVGPGMTVLVHGAGAGVGAAAVQISRLFGARVLATAGSAAKRERARAMGAEAAIDYQRDGWVQDVLDHTSGRGVDVVIDHVGGQTLERSLQALAVGGTLVNCGVTAGNVVELDFRTIYPRQLAIMGSMLGSRAEMITAMECIARGELAPVIERVLPLAEAPAAHALMESRDLFGKIVLEVSSD